MISPTLLPDATGLHLLHLADGSCPFVPGVLAWPVAYTQLPRLTGKGDETRASFASSITFGDMLREKLDYGKNLLRT